LVYMIRLLRRAEKDLARLAQRDCKRVAEAIDRLADDPRPGGCEPVKTAPHGTYRIRVGDYRVIYVVIDEENLVIVTRVRLKGKDTYKE